jgi:hypothetical protein
MPLAATAGKKKSLITMNADEPFFQCGTIVSFRKMIVPMLLVRSSAQESGRRRSLQTDCPHHNSGASPLDLVIYCAVEGN